MEGILESPLSVSSSVCVQALPRSYCTTCNEVIWSVYWNRHCPSLRLCVSRLCPEVIVPPVMKSYGGYIGIAIVRLFICVCPGFAQKLSEPLNLVQADLFLLYCKTVLIARTLLVKGH